MSEASKQPHLQTEDKGQQNVTPVTQLTGPLPGFYAALRTAIVSAVFVLVVIGILLWNAAHSVSKDPLDSPRYAELQKRLTVEPQNEELKEQIRELDLELRQAYFRSRLFNQWGTILLIAGLIVFAISARIASTLRRPLPRPAASEVWDEAFEQGMQQRRIGLLAFTGLLVLTVIAFLAGGQSIIRETLAFRSMTKIKAAHEMPQEQGGQTQAPGQVTGPTSWENKPRGSWGEGARAHCFA
jgi:hypothetical protein